MSAAPPSLFPDSYAQLLESPRLKGPVAFPVVAETDAPTGLVLLDS